VTHDIDEAIKMGDRIAIMRDGALVQYDTPDTILAHPINRFVRDFVGTDRSLKRLGLFKIEDLMDADAPSITLNTTVDEARRIMNSIEARSLFIVDEHDGRLKGWIDQEELEQNNSLIDAMYEAPYTDISVRKSATAREALSAMVARSFRVTPVVNRDGQLVGTITLKALQDLASYDPNATPPPSQNGSAE
jgi:osmoprotectant transport system ATP-binding protein